MKRRGGEEERRGDGGEEWGRERDVEGPGKWSAPGARAGSRRACP